ncbi:hypothetical protein LEN26_013176 [Aphanomyces euteiches]|nr:hypothetical protein AeMF1_012749 [Aphanomyces euteiches]KAH9113306.1 hypothetical protein LEN26_013176 [Aphanomyces euteiches]KAH9195814.1 hypothetical protein AeNC1_002203 [Aphanomyces euteiches]
MSKKKVAAKKSTTVEDLTLLVTLDEITILNALQARFKQSFIYTSTGAILLAINPFRPIDHLYSPDVQQEYIDHGYRRMMGEKLEKMPPHVYAVADTAFRDMNRDMWVRPDNPNTNVVFQAAEPESMPMVSSNQSILVSGESGAGKTETAKIIMHYLGSVSMATAHDGHAKDHIRSRVLESNPILEAFGNARTNRNNNSSRFGKFIRLGFDPAGSLLGASILTYLLERVRLVSQAPGERNYHIFYELLSSPEDARAYGLGSVESYNYVNKSGCFVRLDGVDDKVSFAATRHAMTTMGMSSEEQNSVLQLVAAILHLGNVQFDAIPGDSGGSVIRPSTVAALDQAAKLLGVDAATLEKSLCSKDIIAGFDQVTVLLSPDKAEVTRDVVAKTMYAELFDWLVARINESIQYTPQDPAADRFIGVVDIFGFEIFETNSLEQLCINFANEKLQQLFSQFVFEKEQEEYICEAIPWEFVEYPNNDACVALFEARRGGLLPVLDEESRLPSGNDQHLVQTYYDMLAKHPHFNVSPLQKKILHFQIVHYAGSVTYVGEGFCEKNKDHAHADALSFFAGSTFPLYQSMFKPLPEGPLSSPANRPLSSPSNRPLSSPAHRSKQASTVVSKFRTQLTSLLSLLHTTEPHFIRCVKPNDSASSEIFDETRVTEQLRCSGVLEAAKISRTGYPLRFSHAAFVHSYICLCPGVRADDPTSMRKSAQDIIHVFRAGTFMQPANEPPIVFADEGREPFQLGLTKVFMVLSVYEQLNAVRETLFGASVLDIQRVIRGWLARVHYRRCYAAILKIQSTFRMSVIRRAFLQLRQSMILVQKIVRGYLARIKYIRWKQNRAAIRIQSTIRCFLARRIVNHKRVHKALRPVVSELESVLEYSKQMELEQEEQQKKQQQQQQQAAQQDMRGRGNSTRSVRLDEFSEDSDSDFDDDGIVMGDHNGGYAAAPLPPRRFSSADTYEVEAIGQLGVCFEAHDGRYTVHKVHATLSQCVDISSVNVGDVLVAINGQPVRSIQLPLMLQTSHDKTLLFYPPVERRTTFRFHRSKQVIPKTTSALSSNKAFDVLWDDSRTLGVSLRKHPQLNVPQVGQIVHYDNPGMVNLHEGDILIALNGLDIRRMEFSMILDLMKDAVRPIVLTFESSVPTYSTSSISLLDGSFLFHVIWDDGNLGVALKQPTGGESVYPKVIHVNMKEHFMQRRAVRNEVKISRGDRLVKINHQSIRHTPYASILEQLRDGPKPVILTFQKRKKTKQAA